MQVIDYSVPVNLSISQLYALQSIILGHRGFCRKACADYGISVDDLYALFEAHTDAYVTTLYHV